MDEADAETSTPCRTGLTRPGQRHQNLTTPSEPGNVAKVPKAPPTQTPFHPSDPTVARYTTEARAKASMKGCSLALRVLSEAWLTIRRDEISATSSTAT